MKNIRKILVCILAALFLFGVVAGCSKEGGETPVTPGSENLAPATPGAWEGGTHEIYVEEGSADFISNGRSDYVIVIPDECGDLVETAASEISVLIYEASGITLDVVTDAALPNTNYISVGNTQAAASAGVSIILEGTTRRNEPSSAKSTLMPSCRASHTTLERLTRAFFTSPSDSEVSRTMRSTTMSLVSFCCDLG